MTKKIILILVSLLAVLAIVAYIGVQFFLGSAVKAGVNKVGPRLTQSNVQLADAQISPFTGTGTLSGFTVENPPGWTAGKAISLGQVHVNVDPKSIFGDHIIVNELIIDQPELVYETKVVASNIGDLLKNIEKAMGGGADREIGKEEGPPTKFEVKHLRVQNGRVTVGVGATALVVPLPPIELNDLGTREGGITAGQLAFAVMRSITTSVIGAVANKSAGSAGQIGSALGGAANETLKGATESLKKILGGKNDEKK